jgi:hypothetical protein
MKRFSSWETSTSFHILLWEEILSKITSPTMRYMMKSMIEKSSFVNEKNLHPNQWYQLPPNSLSKFSAHVLFPESASYSDTIVNKYSLYETIATAAWCEQYGFLLIDSEKLSQTNEEEESTIQVLLNQNVEDIIWIHSPPSSSSSSFSNTIPIQNQNPRSIRELNRYFLHYKYPTNIIDIYQCRLLDRQVEQILSPSKLDLQEVDNAKYHVFINYSTTESSTTKENSTSSTPILDYFVDCEVNMTPCTDECDRKIQSSDLGEEAPSTAITSMNQSTNQKYKQILFTSSDLYRSLNVHRNQSSMNNNYQLAFVKYHPQSQQIQVLEYFPMLRSTEASTASTSVDNDTSSRYIELVIRQDGLYTINMQSAISITSLKSKFQNIQKLNKPKEWRKQNILILFFKWLIIISFFFLTAFLDKVTRFPFPTQVIIDFKNPNQFLTFIHSPQTDIHSSSSESHPPEIHHECICDNDNDNDRLDNIQDTETSSTESFSLVPVDVSTTYNNMLEKEESPPPPPVCVLQIKVVRGSRQEKGTTLSEHEESIINELDAISLKNMESYRDQFQDDASIDQGVMTTIERKMNSPSPPPPQPPPPSSPPSSPPLSRSHHLPTNLPRNPSNIEELSSQEEEKITNHHEPKEPTRALWRSLFQSPYKVFGEVINVARKFLYSFFHVRDDPKKNHTPLH